MLVACSLFFQPSFAQCITPPPLDSCQGTEPMLADHETLNAGVKKWFYGAATTYNDLTMNGGTLVVCGNLTIDKFYMDSGTIVIRPGARFVIGGGIGYGAGLRGNSAIYNHGTFECVRNLSLEGNWASVAKPNVVINVLPTSIFKMSNQYFVINNPHSYFVNNGKADFHGLIIDPGAASGSVCLGNGSETKMTVLYNKKANSYTVPSGQACLNVTEFSQFHDTLTRSTNLNVCLGPRHYSDSACRPWGCKPNAWGNASLFRICNMCMEIQNLTVTISNFKIADGPDQKRLSWDAAINSHSEIEFLIERSRDGKAFFTIDSFTVGGEQRRTQFSRSDMNPVKGFSYYRVTGMNRLSGHRVSSPTIKTASDASEEISIYPNPFSTTINIIPRPGQRLIRVDLLTMEGRLLYTKEITKYEWDKCQVHPPQSLLPATYILRLIDNDGTELRKIRKE